jgi:hypothetical protein
MSGLQDNYRPRRKEEAVMSSKSSSIATLITRLDDALALYAEPAWRELRDLITTEKTTLPVKEWYKAHPEQMAKENKVLSKLLSPLSGSTGIFFQQGKTDRLGATGLARLAVNKNLKVEIIFPDDYPEFPPRVFLFGSAIKKIPQLLREDGSVPVPFGANQQWTSESNSGMVLAWAIEWLEEIMKIESAPTEQDSSRGRSG